MELVFTRVGLLIVKVCVLCVLTHVLEDQPMIVMVVCVITVVVIIVEEIVIKLVHISVITHVT